MAISISHAYAIALGVLFTWSTLITILRLCVRYKKTAFRESDGLTIVVLVISIIITSMGLSVGWLVLSDRPPDYSEIAVLHRIALEFLFLNCSIVLIVPATKACIILLLFEVETRKNRRRWLRALQLCCAIIPAVVFLPLSFFGCYQSVASTYWGVLAQNSVPQATHGIQPKCVPRQGLILANGIFNGLLEVAIFIAAASIVRRIDATKMQKLGLICTFGLGLVTMVITVVNTTINFRACAAQSRAESASQYSSREGFLVAGISAAAEINAGLTIASILPIRAALLAMYSRCAKRISKTAKLPHIVALKRLSGSMFGQTRSEGTTECLDPQFDDCLYVEEGTGEDFKHGKYETRVFEPPQAAHPESWQMRKTGDSSDAQLCSPLGHADRPRDLDV